MIFNTDATLEMTLPNADHVIFQAKDVKALIDQSLSDPPTLIFATELQDYPLDITGTSSFTLISSIRHFINHNMDNINVNELLRTSITYTQKLKAKE